MLEWLYGSNTLEKVRTRLEVPFPMIQWPHIMYTPLGPCVYTKNTFFICENEGSYSNNRHGMKKNSFLRPHLQYVVSDRDIWGGKTSDNLLQVSNTICDGGYTCGQPLLTEVVEIVKKLLFWSINLIFPILQVNLTEI